MKIEKTSLDGVTVMNLSGRFDAGAAADFKREAQIFSCKQQAKLVVEMGGVSYIDSGGLGSLVSILRETRNNNGDVKIAVVPDTIHYAFELTRIHRIFEIYDDAAVAAASFSTN